MYYIYDKATSRIESNPTRGKHYLKAEYKTMGAAKAALTRMHKKFEAKRFELLASKYQFERDSKEAQAENSPLYTCGIAEADYYHKTIEKFETVYSMMDKDKTNPIRQSINTPAYMDPSRESYWSM